MVSNGRALCLELIIHRVLFFFASKDEDCSWCTWDLNYGRFRIRPPYLNSLSFLLSLFMVAKVRETVKNAVLRCWIVRMKAIEVMRSTVLFGWNHSIDLFFGFDFTCIASASERSREAFSLFDFFYFIWRMKGLDSLKESLLNLVLSGLFGLAMFARKEVIAIGFAHFQNFYCFAMMYMSGWWWELYVWFPITYMKPHMVGDLLIYVKETSKRHSIHIPENISIGNYNAAIFKFILCTAFASSYLAKQKLGNLATLLLQIDGLLSSYTLQGFRFPISYLWPPPVCSDHVHCHVYVLLRLRRADQEKQKIAICVLLYLSGLIRR